MYQTQKKKYSNSPAFYFDCAHHFYESNVLLANQILSNIAELELSNISLLRVMAQQLIAANEFDDAISALREVKYERPEEPQSHRDLALACIGRADLRLERATRQRLTVEGSRILQEKVKADYTEAIKLLAHVVTKKWQRFAEIELIALSELNNLFNRLDGYTYPLDEAYKTYFKEDIRITLSWDADATDIDLWVTEPSNEKVTYSHNRSTIGGRLSRDFTGGYGPEEYTVRKAMKGIYKIQANYYGSSQSTISGPVNVTIDIYTNYGSHNQKHKRITKRLSNVKKVIDFGEIEWK